MHSLLGLHAPLEWANSQKTKMWLYLMNPQKMFGQILYLILF